MPRKAPLTELQLHFIHGSLKQPGTNFIVHSEMYDTVMIPRLKDAWKKVIESETIFNQDFPEHESLDKGLKGFNWSESRMPDDAPDSQMPQVIGSFFWVTPVGNSSKKALSRLTWTVHHCLIDGYSASIIFDKVLRTVNGDLTVSAGPSFRLFTEEFELLRSARKELGKAYWARQEDTLSQARHDLLLPPAYPHNEYAGSSSVAIDISAIAQDIQAKAKNADVTPATLFYAAWAMTLSSFTDAEVVAFGAVLCGRNLPVPGALEVIGPVLNVLPFSISTIGTMTSVEFLQLTFHKLIELEEYQWTTPEHGFDRSFESALSVQVCLPDSRELRIQPLGRMTRQEHEVPLGLTIDPLREVALDYHVNRFTKQNMQHLAETYRLTLELLLDGNRTVDDIRRSSTPQSHIQTLQQFGNCSPSTLVQSIQDDLVTLFERRARDIPGHVALEKGCDKMSYREMDLYASKVAARLQSHIEKGEIVCIYSDRSLLWLCAVFGILKAGGVYCSMDPTEPQEVRNRKFSLSGSKVFITSTACQLSAVPEVCAVSFTIQSTVESPDFADWGHRQVPEPQSPAYVCFTSGSTGTPKGVLCTHAGLVAFQSSLDVRLFAAPGRRIAHIMSVAFDGSIHEIFSALTHGATLVLPSGSDPFGHLHSVDAAILTPSLARLLDPNEFKHLKWVYFVGEPVPQAVCDRWASVKQLYNMYGPTEGTCGATIKRLLPRQPVTIGIPNNTTRVYILTTRQSEPSKKTLCPPGVIGELYLAGVQIANGYLDMPEQTRERFLPDSVWPSGVGEMMYRTGDRGYWTEEGEVALLGRNDREIKLRGYRLDMGDLEIRIARAYPLLQAVAVARRQDQLIAMVQPLDINVGDLRDQLRKVLPQYAMPHIIAPVDKLPVTAAGKTDYKAVAEADPPRRSESRKDKLSSSTELDVAKAYRIALQLPDSTTLNASSRFIDLGGHSLRQLELLRHLSATTGVQLSLKMVLINPTIRDLAMAVAERISLAPSPVDDHNQKFPIQEELATPIETEWMRKYLTSASSSAFNVCYSSRFDNNVVSKERLITAWNSVLARHHLLGCRYTYRNENEVIRVNPGYVPRVQTPCSLELSTEVNRPFALDVEEPVRVFVTADSLTIVMSHIIADYTALAILMREASEAYHGSLLDDAPRSYALARVWSDAISQSSLDFWTGYLQDCPENPQPFGSDVSRSDYSGTSTLTTIDADIFEKALEYSVATNTTLQQIALACVAMCLDECPFKTDIVLGVPHINRDTADDLNTFGLFLQPLPVRIQCDTNSENDVTEATKLSSQQALAHAIPWDQLLQHLGIVTQYPNHPLFDVMVTMHDFRQANDLNMSVPGFEPLLIWSEGAKFKLMCEFTALPNGKLMLRLEYDSGLLSESQIQRIRTSIPIAMRLISSGRGHKEIKLALGNMQKNSISDSGVLSPECCFGKSLRDL
ncbi:nonribosomal peptide synthase GliP-like protein [Dothidotthia symphoricarpi CBS 119687]|uniref:Nonribosomal peptide synthase GliP-like protein n=1 Tax=Dothidotthia symphoricarpi CBS 119687 TaxID=1392245 RepID=A0A6A6AAQ3_9PLEO|nr:nonribosomal peptide synthase GliP-like protein [Dothidotthia symphoricarpi CBS 119687]KAF2128303.1 nonribosomal peptide synthase GliP-like protein [Dothidotthia symphoricarpi CBS 119687]